MLDRHWDAVVEQGGAELFVGGARKRAAADAPRNLRSSLPEPKRDSSWTGRRVRGARGEYRADTAAWRCDDPCVKRCTT
jgi:hypothetical protein